MFVFKVGVAYDNLLKTSKIREQLLYSLNAVKYFILHYYYEDVLIYVKKGRQTNQVCVN